MARLKYKGPRRIAPRLANGESRANYGGRLPHYVKEGLRMKAYTDGMSMSFLMEQMLIGKLGLPTPEYVPPKKPTPDEESKARGTKKGD